MDRADGASATPVIAVANLKGGAGKTTTAVFLANLFAQRVKTLLVDADPQGSALAWASACDLDCATVAMPGASLHETIGDVAASYGCVVVDTPPGHLPIVRSALMAASLTVVPLQPTKLDVSRAGAMVQLAQEAREAGGRFALRFLLTRTRARTRSITEIRGVLETGGLDLFGCDLLEQPAVGGALPAVEGLAAEEEGDLAGGAVGAVRAVHEVAPRLEGEVAADGAGGRLDGAGRAHRPARGGDRVRPLEHRRHQRARRDVVHEAAEERLALVLGVVPPRQRLVGAHQPQRDQPQPAPFEASQHLADQPALHRVRLHEDQRSLHGSSSLRSLRRPPARAPGA